MNGSCAQDARTALIQQPGTTDDEIHEALAGVTIADVADATVARVNTQQDPAHVMREALHLAGCTDVDEWLRVFSQVISPDVSKTWLPLLQPVESN